MIFKYITYITVSLCSFLIAWYASKAYYTQAKTVVDTNATQSKTQDKNTTVINVMQDNSAIHIAYLDRDELLKIIDKLAKVCIKEGASNTFVLFEQNTT
ncbi:MAG: hypothetical protein RL154_29, partial [Pseudomonadota bacterium]